MRLCFYLSLFLCAMPNVSISNLFLFLLYSFFFFELFCVVKHRNTKSYLIYSSQLQCSHIFSQETSYLFSFVQNLFCVRCESIFSGFLCAFQRLLYALFLQYRSLYRLLRLRCISIHFSVTYYEVPRQAKQGDVSNYVIRGAL